MSKANGEPDDDVIEKADLQELRRLREPHTSKACDGLPCWARGSPEGWLCAMITAYAE